MFLLPLCFLPKRFVKEENDSVKVLNKEARAVIVALTSAEIAVEFVKVRTSASAACCCAATELLRESIPEKNRLQISQAFYLKGKGL